MSRTATNWVCRYFWVDVCVCVVVWWPKITSTLVNDIFELKRCEQKGEGYSHWGGRVVAVESDAIVRFARTCCFLSLLSSSAKRTTKRLVYGMKHTLVGAQDKRTNLTMTTMRTTMALSTSAADITIKTTTRPVKNISLPAPVRFKIVRINKQSKLNIDDLKQS